MDEIKLTGLRLYGHHGVLPQEKEKGQEFWVDITFKVDTRKAGKNDNLSLTLNYADAADYICKIFDKDPKNLIECVAEDLAEKLLLKFRQAEEITVTVHKPSAPLEHPFSDVNVTITRRWHEVFIAVGSNIGDSREIIEAGKMDLFSAEDIDFIKGSDLITTKPYGYTDQPDFLNGMWKARTLMSPEELLERLHKVEAGQDRERTIKWGPRTLDLDIIYYDDIFMETEELTIPHADMCNRAFVLEPLEKTDPCKRHPVNGKTAGEMLKDLKAREG